MYSRIFAQAASSSAWLTFRSDIGGDGTTRARLRGLWGYGGGKIGGRGGQRLFVEHDVF